MDHFAQQPLLNISFLEEEVVFLNLTYYPISQADDSKVIEDERNYFWPILRVIERYS